ncbi:glycosyltransferase family 2 protein [Candidatus Peregrinibacteria bacterium]|nr:glycosyltransferase family 2 protein [Candidatus Peregrinibacteria bacterium]MBI3817015.1 glycosyltransferase family 2 protein [Candidatus Peregrinibacteria bacterium]
MTLSLIIPTHRRADILKECLSRIARQTIGDQLEVIVVSDGQDEETVKLFEDTRSKTQDTKFLEIPPCHQGVARNRGVQAATADLCLFIGDDIFLEPDACEKHLRCHGERCRTMATKSPFDRAQGDIRTQSTIAVLGHTTWDPALEITKVMLWLERSGWQFGYPMIERYAHRFLPSTIQRRFTYTSHLSLPTAIAKQFPFREDVSLYGWEDIEWGLRLAKAGIRLFYEPDAKTLHHHPMTLKDSLKRMETLGRSAVEIEKLVSELNVVPKGWKRIAYALASKLPTMRGKHARAFLRGTERPLELV